MNTRIRSPRSESIRRARMNAADADRPARRLSEPIPVSGGWFRVAYAKSPEHHLTNEAAADLFVDLANGDNLRSRRALMDAGIIYMGTDPTEPASTPAPLPTAPLSGSPAPVEAALSVPAGVPASPSEPAAALSAAAPVPVVAITGAPAGADPSTARCAPGRKRHRYGPGDSPACMYCGGGQKRGAQKNTGEASGSDQDRGLAKALETPVAPAPEITTAEPTTTPPPRTAVSPALLSKAQADALPPFGGAGAPSVSGPGATSVDRSSYIGSADAPAILGLSPHSTPWDVFAKKVGAVEDSGGDWLEMGLDLEPVIAKWAARQLEAHNMRKGETLLHPDETWAGATVDYFATVPGSTVVIVECKALGSFSPWKDDEVPLHIVAQVHWQCGIARAAGVWADRLFVARMKGLEVKVFEVRYEPALFDAMLAKCRAFWAQVQAKTPPPIDGSLSAKAWLESVYPAARKALRPATEAEVFTITQYVVARDQAGAAKKRQDAAANEIRALIGDAEGVIGGGVVAKWSGKEGAARRLDVRAVTGKGDE